LFAQLLSAEGPPSFIPEPEKPESKEAKGQESFLSSSTHNPAAVTVDPGADDQGPKSSKSVRVYCSKR